MSGLEQVLADAGLHERADVLAALLAAHREAACAQPRGAVLLTGAAGAGKTAVLDALAGLVACEGGVVLRATCSALELDFPFAAVQQLLGARRRPELTADLFGALDALWWELVARTEEGPVALLVDDAHWADDPSLRWLHYLLHRLSGVRVLPVLAVRTGTSPRPLLAALSALPGTVQLPVPPLTVQGAGALLRGRVPCGVPEELVAQCHEATGGNAFYLAALALAMRERGTARVEAALSARTAPLPETAGRAVLDRLHALGPEAVQVVRAVAVLGADAGLGAVAQLTALGEERAAQAVAAARDSGLLQPAPTWAVAHPLVHDAVYAELDPGQRSDLHREAARQLAAAGAEPERVAVHLSSTQPGDDLWVVESLLAGARRALQRGAPEAAVAYLRRALTEPLARHAAPALLELGRAELLVGDPAAADHLRDAVQLASDDATRGDAARQLARALVYAGDVPAAVALLTQVRAGLADPDGALAVQLDLEAVDAARLELNTAPQAEALLSRYAGWDEDRPCGHLVLAHLAYEPARRGRSAELACALARRALAGDVLLAEQGADSQGPYLAVLALLLSDALDEARAHLDAALRQSRAQASLLGFCLASAWRSHAALRAGDVVAAGADATAVLAAAGGAGLHVLTPYGVAFSSDVLVERGDLDAADRLWREHGLDGPLPPALPSNHLLFSRGCLRAAQGRTTAAVDDLLASGERQRRWRAEGPGLWPWASRAALALSARGEGDRARSLVDEEHAAAVRFGAPRPIGMALHARALLEHGPARAHGLQQALDVLAGSPARLEHARVLVDLGAALLRTGRHAQGRTALEDGLRRAVACGATALSARARDELVAAGVTPRRAAVEGVEALTISERRVAQLAATGSTNREIAQALFVTPKTVETHLARAFRKLGVAGRRELPGVQGLHGELDDAQEEPL